jgi:chlorobactene glucosyltransferase
VIPARNEERNIARCVRSVLASSYPNLQVGAVDDHSTDDTGVILGALAASDSRLTVTTPPPLPPDWFGKQWACAHGASLAQGEIIAFFDADTWQSPDLITRTVNAMRERSADLMSVVGRQEFGTFWEKVLQPQVFSIMLTRYGGSEVVNDAKRPWDKIANGQCIFVRRDAYVAMGGHGAVRNRAAEDLAMAQHWFAEGKRSFLVMGLEQLTTRMYTSLAELRAGWGKNIFAAGRESAPYGLPGRIAFPFLMFAPALAGLVPPIILALALLGVLGDDAFLWSSIATAANTIWWFIVYRSLEMSSPRALGYSLLHPLGALLLFEICLGALVRGRKVTWKDRRYISA